MENIFLYFFVAGLTCFIGTIPFGPINLMVVKTTVDYDKRRGLEVALAASIVEIFEALIAICFGLVISNYLEANLQIKLAIALLFIVLAIIVFTRKTDPTLANTNDDQRSLFRKGLVIAALNPQAIPFWIFALAAISQYFEFQYIGSYLVSFLVGVFAGKLLALYGFVVASAYLKTHLQQSSQLVNRLLAAILLFIGVTQGWTAISGLL